MQDFPRFFSFNDPCGNFSLQLPTGWIYDKDFIVSEGSYTIEFRNNTLNPSQRQKLVVSVSTRFCHIKDQGKLNIEFANYSFQELNSPASGVIANVEKTNFLHFPAYKKSYTYSSDGTLYEAANIIFISVRGIIFSMFWSYPKIQESGTPAKIQTQTTKTGKEVLDKILETFVC